MNRIFFTLVLCMISTVLNAAIGDTTVILTHDKTRLTSFGNFDIVANFPDSTHSYNRIMMEFELGKYACDGYNPNNRGDELGQTGWCADWDYDVHVIACTPNGDTVEMGRLITPYANSLFPQTPANWSHSYWFDVTDYYTLLKDNVTIRIVHAGEHGGFTSTVRFHMIEGPRNRNVLSLVPLWHKEYPYNTRDTSINELITPQKLLYPVNTKSVEYKMFLTGHGGSIYNGCAEFCKKWYILKVNDLGYDLNWIWRDDCSSNFLYPQSGEWIRSRANWCPGNVVHPFRHNITSLINAGDSFNIDLQFQEPTIFFDYGSYKVAGAAFFYSQYYIENDASIEAIITPTDNPEYNRQNPTCDNASVKVKNRGGNDINTLHFKYGLGAYFHSYIYRGLIKPEEELIIDLPNLVRYNNSEKFLVKIDSVNNEVDQMTYNNTLSSKVVPLPIIEYGTLLVRARNIENPANVLKYSIKSIESNFLYERHLYNPNEIKNDLITLPNGCYELEVTTSAGCGLNYFNPSNAGYFNIYNIYNDDTTKIALPKNDLENVSLAGNFGSGFKQHFIVTNSQALNTDQIDKAIDISIYPNPANHSFTISHKGLSDNDAKVIIYDALGRKVSEYNNVKNHEIFKTDQLANGIYMVQYTLDNHIQTMKLNVLK